MVRRTILAVVLFMGVAQGSAQGGSDAFLHCTVTDRSTGEPVPLAHVLVMRPERTWESWTDFDGWTMVRCPQQWMVLVVQAPGYARFDGVVDLWTKAVVEVDVALVPEGQGP